MMIYIGRDTSGEYRFQISIAIGFCQNASLDEVAWRWHWEWFFGRVIG